MITSKLIITYIIAYHKRNVNSDNIFYLCYNKLMFSAKIISNRLMKNDRKADIMHSSGYAKVQNGQGLGVTSADDFATRKTLDSQRKYVQKYKNSRIMRNYYGAQRARTVEAQVERGTGRYGATSVGTTETTKRSTGVVDRTANGVASRQSTVTDRASLVKPSFRPQISSSMIGTKKR